MKHLIMALTGLFLVTSAYTQTCDLTLISQTPPATTEDDHSFVVEFVNAENCGCNEFTQYDGNTCDGNGSSSVNNNENVSHLVFGIHYVNEITGLDLGENTDCTSTTFHPGWSYTNVTNWGGWETGDVVTININPPFAWECILATPLEGYCWEVVIWQINLSQTAGYDDFPDNGWTVGNSFNQIAVLSAAEGEIFDIGDIPEYLNYGGYVLDWDKVLNLYGEGTYQFVVFDTVNPLLSYPFRLKTSNCNSMNGTSKIEVIQRGLYANYNYKKQEGNIKTFDVQSIDWFDSIRLNAKIVPTELTQEIESIKYANDREETFFNQGFQNYDFNVFECDYELFKRFLHFATKGKDIRISNYNLDAETELIGVNVVATGESESSKFPKNKLLYQISIKFKDEFLDKYRAC